MTGTTVENIKTRTGALLRKYDGAGLKVPAVLIVLGLLLCGAGFHLVLAQKYTAQEGVSAEGRVVEMHSDYSADSDGGGSYVYYPVVEFKDVNNQAVIFRDRIGSNPASYRIGETVGVLYDPQNPGRAFIDQDSASLLPAALLLGAGILTLWFGVNGVLAARARHLSSSVPENGRRDDDGGRQKQGALL